MDFLNRFLETFAYFLWKITILSETVKSNYFYDKKHDKAQLKPFNCQTINIIDVEKLNVELWPEVVLIKKPQK